MYKQVISSEEEEQREIQKALEGKKEKAKERVKLHRQKLLKNKKQSNVRKFDNDRQYAGN